MKKIYITKEQAESLLPDNDNIHTFYNFAWGLMGADWSRNDILDKIEKSDLIELTGESARKMGHGICVYDKSTQFQSDILFIQTNESRLTELEKELEYK